MSKQPRYAIVDSEHQLLWTAQTMEQAQECLNHAKENRDYYGKVYLYVLQTATEGTNAADTTKVEEIYREDINESA